MPKHKDQEIQEHNYKAICLLYAYVNNVPLACETLKKNIKEIIVVAPKLISVSYKSFKSP